jgi:hypothetical protein
MNLTMIRDSSRISPTIHNQSWSAKNKIKTSIDQKNKNRVKTLIGLKKFKNIIKTLVDQKKSKTRIKASIDAKI